MQMRVIGDDIIFQFVDDVINGTVRQTTTKSGIILAGSQMSEQQQARWGIVVGKGEKVPDDIVIGEYILIEPLMWTPGFTFDTDKKYWKTVESKVLATAESLE
jgi:co-chaperonin GroES (HSP10)